MSTIDEYSEPGLCDGLRVGIAAAGVGHAAGDEAAADAVWKKHRLPSGDQVVVLNSGEPRRGEALAQRTLCRLARRIATDRECPCWFCAAPPNGVAREIIPLADHPRVTGLADGGISVGLSKACVRRSRLLVTTDSGPRFFAVAFNVPVISLFGPTPIAAWTRTHYEREICLHHAVPCGPCGQRTCPLKHHECMRSLSVDRVYATVGAIESPANDRAA